jgi:hypothetical protein
MRSAVRLAAITPAMRAAPITSPFADWASRTAANAAALIAMVPSARALRTDAGLPLTSTIDASPAAPTWESAGFLLPALLKRASRRR